jgi:hypothetical protein
VATAKKVRHSYECSTSVRNSVPDALASRILLHGFLRIIGEGPEEVCAHGLAGTDNQLWRILFNPAPKNWKSIFPAPLFVFVLRFEAGPLGEPRFPLGRRRVFKSDRIQIQFKGSVEKRVGYAAT